MTSKLGSLIISIPEDRQCETCRRVYVEKPFHLFAGMQYYPSMGLGDYVDCYKTLEEAEAAAVGQGSTKPYYWYSIMQVSTTGRLVEVAGGGENEGPEDAEVTQNG